LFLLNDTTPNNIYTLSLHDALPIYKIIQNNGIEFSFVDMTREENIARAIKPNTKMIWVETPTNPMLKLVDIEMVARLCKPKNITDRKSTRLNSSHVAISYAVFCLKK